MAEKELVPELRFKEFSPKWNISSINKIFAIKNGYAFSSSNSQACGTRWIKIADVGIGRVKNDSLSYLPNSFLEDHENYILKEGDYVVALTRPILNGRLKIARIDKFASNSLLNQRVGKIESENDLEFIFQRLNDNSLIRKIEVLISGSDPPNLSPKDIKSIRLAIPLLSEQQKIASFLSAIDKRIALLEKKKALLEQYKKGVLQQIFSQEIRFKDENGNEFPDWEEKKIEDIFSITRGQVLAAIKASETKSEINNFPVYSSQTKNRGLMGYYSEYLFENSLTWTTDGANAGDVNYRKGKFYCTNVCGVLISDEGYANSFIAEKLKSISYKHVSYVGNPKLMNNVMAKIRIEVPSSLQEQKSISAFFELLNDLISKMNDSIESEMKFKKGLLQKMFV
ncbi:MAG: restriction endonuclease subunit S [Vicingaceae bacterium]